MPDHDSAATFQTPRNPAQLHAWIKQHLNISIAQQAIIPGHTPPFDYICHTFFEGQGRWPSADVPAPQGPLDAIVWANRGGGKTFLGALATALDLLFKPGIQIRILAGSLEQAQHMHHHLRAIFERPDLAAMIDGRITDRRLRLKNRSIVQLLAQSQASIRGTRIQKLRCDEVELFAPEVWEAAQLTTRSARCGGIYVRGAIECLSTMHKPHGIMRKLIQETRSGARRIFKWGIIDALEKCPDHLHCQGHADAAGNAAPCPLLPECSGKAKTHACGHITVEDALQMKSRVSASVWEAEMLCQRADRSDAVFPEFDHARHIITSDPHPRTLGPWIGGMDFGYRAPTVFLWGALDRRGQLYILDERIARHTLLEDHIRAILDSSWPRLDWIGIDPAAEATSAQTGQSDASLLRQYGLRLRSRCSRIVEGLTLIRARLAPADGPPRLFIHQRCKGLIEALDTYHYSPEHPESEEPVKDGPDHACDALRYLILNLQSTGKTKVEHY